MVFKRSLDDSENESAKRANLSSKEFLEDVSIISEGQEDQGNETDKKVDSMMNACKNGCLEIVEEHIKQGFDVNSRDNTSNAALHYAAENGYVEIVKKLLENGALPNLANKYDKTALEFAARNGHFNTVKELLKAGAKDYEYDEYGRHSRFSVLTNLHFPKELSENHIEIIMEIVKSRPHPTHEAINRLKVPNSIVIFRRLLKEGISPDLQDQRGDTALHRVVYERHSDVSLLVEVLKHGVNMEIKNNDQETPLMTAFMVERPEYVKELLKYGANPNHQISRLRRNTLLHEVCKRGDISMVKVLLSHGADVNGLGMDNRTPLHSTTLCNLYNTYHYQIIKELLLNGADVNLKDKNNMTVISYAAFQGIISKNLFQELMKKCDDPNVVCSVDGKTPLQNAIGSESKVKILLDHGADPYIRDFDNPFIAKFDKNTAFETALRWRQEKTFKVMIYRN